MPCSKSSSWKYKNYAHQFPGNVKYGEIMHIIFFRCSTLIMNTVTFKTYFVEILFDIIQEIILL